MIFVKIVRRIIPHGYTGKVKARGKLCVSLVCLRGALRKCGRL